jgi:superfamily II DNA/RNA helicase
MTSFRELGLNEKFDSFFSEQGFKHPSDVQKAVVPKMIAGDSVVVLAQTGTGKTLSYALPIVEILRRYEVKSGRDAKPGHPMALVLLPTRELVEQVGGVFQTICHHVRLRVKTATGGMAPEKLKEVKREVCDILVASPSKARELFDSGHIQFDRLKSVVFDEADTLLEMGFYEDILGLESAFRLKKSQVSFFTATMPQRMEKLIEEKFEPYYPSTIKMPGAHRFVKRITSTHVPLEESQRIRMLIMMMQRSPEGRGIIFVTRKEDAQSVFESLTKDCPRLKKAQLHGDMAAEDRRKNYKSMEEGKVQVLVATDLAARGMDFKDIAWVINYDLPKTTDFFLHRCGRTGRMGAGGHVINFVSPRDRILVAKINAAITANTEMKIESIPDLRFRSRRTPNVELTPEEKERMAKAKIGSAKRGKGRLVSKLEKEDWAKERNFVWKKIRAKKAIGRKKK